MRRSLPRITIVFTSVTFTLKSFWTASGSPPCSRARDLEDDLVVLAQQVAFSVRMMGLTDDFLGGHLRSSLGARSCARRLLEAALLERLRRVLGEDQRVVPEEVVHVDPLRRQELVLLAVADRERGSRCDASTTSALFFCGLQRPSASTSFLVFTSGSSNGRRRAGALPCELRERAPERAARTCAAGDSSSRAGAADAPDRRRRRSARGSSRDARGPCPSACRASSCCR
jgi:hypothetical protein